jgi:hypothetical protein
MVIPIALAKTLPLQSKSNNFVDGIVDNANLIYKLYFEIRELEKENKLSLIKQKKDLMTKLLASADLPTLTTISFPDKDIQSYHNFKCDNNHKPILVRGIASAVYMDQVSAQGCNYYFIETGYFGNYISKSNPQAKKLWHRIVKNSMQHEQVLNVPDDRWKTLCNLDSRLVWPGWKKTGSKILLVAPIDKSAGHYGYTKDLWIKETIEKLQQHTDKEIVIREKMSRPDRTFKKTIYQALDEDIFAVVTLNSIAATEAVAYGIPAFTTAPTSADPVCLKDLSRIETPYYPDEEFVHKWTSSLAYGQFHLEEMLTGNAWRTVLENEQRETISY